jgi:hypothetical protein
MLVGVMMKVVCGWLWHNDRIDSRSEVVLGCLGKLARRIVNDMMGSMVDETVTIALYD